MKKAAQKEKLRKELTERRKSLSNEDCKEKSAFILSSLKTQKEFIEAETVHCYISMSQNKEVDTFELINSMFLKMKRVVVPVVQKENNSLKHVELVNFNQLEENSWGVLEPVNGIEVPVNELDFIIVPMLGGDRNKNRIGYGKGFYDRFLSQANCPNIGLLFEDCLVDEIPVEAFDVPLDKLITEEKIIGRL